jgi:mRNA interferase RelE/StbE
MAYDIQIRRKAQKTLTKIPEPYQTRIIDAIRSLSDTPYPTNSKKLIGRPAWRIRVGNYRAIYEINDNQLIILVLDIDHRKNIYRK